MIAAIHQPQYLPWLGYFDKLDKADMFCYLDNVQYKKNDWQNRNKIKTANGWQWLTTPVYHRFPENINEVIINNTVSWQRKHLQALITNYKKAPFFNDYIDLLSAVYDKEWEQLSELNIELTERIRMALHIDSVKTISASSLKLSEDPTDRLIDICTSLGCDTYLSGVDGAKYMDLSRFKDKRIKVVFQDFVHPLYPQVFGDFVSHLSILDLLFNCGPSSMTKIREVNPYVRGNR